MKIHPFAFVLVACISPAFAEEGWLSNIEKAQEQAKKENKLVLVEFTGSDWCPPCKVLKANVFPSPEFKAIADKSLVTVELDFPRQKEIDPEQKKYNAEMQKKFSIRGYPTVYLLEAENGTPVWVRIGGGDKTGYLKSLEEGIAAAPIIVETLKKAKSAEGMEKAQLLDKAYKAMSPDLQKAQSELAKEIIVLDKDDTMGHAKALKKQEDEEKKQQAVNTYIKENVTPLLKEGKFDEGVAKAKEFADQPSVDKNTKQTMYLRYISGMLMTKGDIDGAIQAIKDGIAIDPASKNAKMFESVLANLEQNKDEIKAKYEKQREKMATLKAAEDKSANKPE